MKLNTDSPASNRVLALDIEISADSDEGRMMIGLVRLSNDFDDDEDDSCDDEVERAAAGVDELEISEHRFHSASKFIASFELFAKGRKRRGEKNFDGIFLGRQTFGMLIT